VICRTGSRRKFLCGRSKFGNSDDLYGRKRECRGNFLDRTRESAYTNNQGQGQMSFSDKKGSIGRSGTFVKRMDGSNKTISSHTPMALRRCRKSKFSKQEKEGGKRNERTWGLAAPSHDEEPSMNEKERRHTTETKKDEEVSYFNGKGKRGTSSSSCEGRE